ncbi:dihydrofolate reductase [Dysgonomonas massiliensis]|uniref:dihydrofolate reductase n=1 Tax=Dysgonomonas massiliensis TaxID=2040292 RepID=UPI000C792070|nr:dihydrofolate reductase [Dysgonomonas massiliensis]
MTKISIIVAADENNAIGKDNELLCYLPNDLKHFKAVTSGHTVVMGRKTFESLPKGALPNRRNIVITRNKDLSFANCEMASSLEEAIGMCNNEDEIFIIGGGNVYSQSISLADSLYLTRIHARFEGVDTYFPQIDEKCWKEVEREDHTADEKHQFAYSFLKFEKIKA